MRGSYGGSHRAENVVDDGTLDDSIYQPRFPDQVIEPGCRHTHKSESSRILTGRFGVHHLWALSCTFCQFCLAPQSSCRSSSHMYQASARHGTRGSNGDLFVQLQVPDITFCYVLAEKREGWKKRAWAKAQSQLGQKPLSISIVTQGNIISSGNGLVTFHASYTPLHNCQQILT